MKYILGIVLGIVVLIIVCIFSCDAAIRHYAQSKLFYDVKDVPENEVGLLLGTTPVTRIGNHPNQFFYYRIDAAVQLYKNHKVRRIIISGSDHSLDNINEVEAMREALVKRGVPDSVLTLDGKGYRTLDSVIRAQRVYKANSIVIISQRFHDERAIYQANHFGLHYKEVVGFIAKDSNSSTSWITFVREYFARVKVFIDIMAA